MFHELVGSLESAFGAGAETVILIGNIIFGDKELDAVLLMPHALFVIEMKNYGGGIHFSENVEWFADDVKVQGGVHRNPYCQLRTNKFAFADHLQRKAQEIIGRGPNFDWWYVCGIVLFGRKIQFNGQLLSFQSEEAGRNISHFCGGAD
jgi:hypothetical protein